MDVGMDVQVEKIQACAVKLSVTLPPERVVQAFDRVLRDMGKTTPIPGFRLGHAPVSIMARYWDAHIHSDVQKRLVRETLEEILTQHEIEPLSQPHVELGGVQRDTCFFYTVTVEVQPEIELKQWKGLTIPHLERRVVTEADVDLALEHLRQKASQLVPILLRDEVQEKSDVILADYEGRIDGAVFERSQERNALIEISRQDYLPDFIEGLMGSKVPSQKEIVVHFPQDYHMPHLAGKTATFVVHLKELKTRELPELDDEFAKDMGSESLDELRQKVRDELKDLAEEEFKTARFRAAVTALIEANPFEVPPTWLESQLHYVIEKSRRALAKDTGQDVTFGPETLKKLEDEHRPEVVFQLRRHMLVEAFDRQGSGMETLRVDDSEVDKNIEDRIAQVGEMGDRLRLMYDDPDRRKELRLDLFQDKLVAHILEHAVPLRASPTTTDGPAAASTSA